MKPTSFVYVLAFAVPVFSSVVKPLVAHDVRYVDVPEKRHLDLDLFENLDERIPTIHLGSFPLAKVFPISYPIVAVTLANSPSANTDISAQLSATCIRCYLTGSAVVTTTGVDKDQSLLDDVLDWIRDPTEVVINALDLNLKVSLENFGGHFELDIAFAAAGTYTIPLFKPSTPVGAQLNDDDKVGLLFTIDLILKVEAAVEFTTGFDIVFPSGSNFVLNPINGNLVSMDLAGASVSALPVKFKKGSACISATLRLKLQAALSVKVLKKGFDFEAGVFFDPAQYKACVEYTPSSQCQVMFNHYFYEEIAAYARAVGDLNFASWSAGPTAITTFVTKTLPTKCLKTSKTKTTSRTPTPTKTKRPEEETTEPTKAHPTTKKSSTSKKSSSKKTSKTSPHESGPTTSSTISRKSSSKSSKKSSGTTSSSHTSSYVSTSSTGSGQETGPHTGSSNTKSGTSSTTKGHTESSYSTVTKTSSGPPYGNFSTKSTSTDSATIPTITDTSATDIPTSDSTTDSITSITDSETTTEYIPTPLPSETTPPESESESETTSTSASPSDTVTSPPGTDTSLTTKTIYTTYTYTITSCQSPLDWCPTPLRIPIVQTKTLIQYTTICPITQTDFPTLAPPSPGATLSFSGVEETSTAIVPPTVIIESPIALTPCPTPIVQTFSGYPSYYTINYKANWTDVYTASNASTTIVVQPSTMPVVPIPPSTSGTTLPQDTTSGSSSSTEVTGAGSSTVIASISIITSTSAIPTSNPPLGPIINSIGGFAAPSPPSDIKAQGTPLSSATASASGTVGFVQSSEAKSGPTISVYVWSLCFGIVLAFDFGIGG